MSRIPAIDPVTAQGKSKELLNALNKAAGTDIDFPVVRVRV